MDDIYGFVALCIASMNGKGHSCQEEELDDGFPASYGFMLVCIHSVCVLTILFYLTMTFCPFSI